MCYLRASVMAGWFAGRVLRFVAFWDVSYVAEHTSDGGKRVITYITSRSIRRMGVKGLLLT